MQAISESTHEVVTESIKHLRAHYLLQSAVIIAAKSLESFLIRLIYFAQIFLSRPL